MPTHKRLYANRDDFHAELCDASFTAGEVLARLSRCGLRPDDLAPYLPPHLHPRWWGDGRAAIDPSVVAMAMRLDAVRGDLVQSMVDAHRNEAGSVVLQVHRTDDDARRWAMANDAGRSLNTDFAVPAFAALHRAAAAEAADLLVKRGVFATVELHDEPMPGGAYSAPVGQDPDWTPPAADTDDPADPDHPFHGLKGRD